MFLNGEFDFCTIRFFEKTAFKFFLFESMCKDSRQKFGMLISLWRLWVSLFELEFVSVVTFIQIKN